MITLYGLRFEAKVDGLQYKVVSCSRWLEEDRAEVERRIPQYKQDMIEKFATHEGGVLQGRRVDRKGHSAGLHLRPENMNTPTKPGWYWLTAGTNQSHQEVVHVIPNRDETGLDYWRIAVSYPTPVNQFPKHGLENWAWAGEVAPPTKEQT